MNDNFENNQFDEKYNPYRFSTPVDPKPEDSEIEPVEVDSIPENPNPTPMKTGGTLYNQADPEWTVPYQEETVSVGTVEPESTPIQPEPTPVQPEPTPVQPETIPVQSDSVYAYSFRKATPKKPEEPKKPDISKILETPEKKKKKSSGVFKKILLCAGLAVVFGAISGGVFLGVAKVGGDLLGLNDSEIQNMEIPKVDTIAPVGDSREDAAETSVSVTGNLTVAQVAERCMPAMVAITTTSITEVPNFFGFGSQNYESTSSGSGIIVDQNEEELLIATNNHVISGATTLTVCFIDDTLVEGMIKGTDAENDLAVVSVKLSDIPAEALEEIKVIQIGNSDELAVGDQVVAIGNALGYGQSVSSGWISALNREVNIDNMTLNLIQTDAAINPGNSGGALLNMKGELIAINESKYADTTVEGMGYAIPVSTATPILSELMSKTTRYKVDEEHASYLGITCKDISAEFASMYGVPTGVYVDSVEENGPAAMAGIKKGDIITKFDGTKLSSYTDLIGQLEYYAAGEIIEITICRADDGEYKEREVMVTLGSKNDTDFLNDNIE